MPGQTGLRGGVGEAAPCWVHEGVPVANGKEGSTVAAATQARAQASSAQAGGQVTSVW